MQTKFNLDNLIENCRKDAYKNNCKDCTATEAECKECLIEELTKEDKDAERN